MNKEKPINQLIFLAAPMFAALCLCGYLVSDKVHINVKVLVVLFWLSVLMAISSLFIRAVKQALKYSAVLLVVVVLYAPASSVFAWTEWWINGFAP